MIINCSKCGKEMNAMEVHVKLCPACMLLVLNNQIVGDVPRRVGIAKKGDLVILESEKRSPEEICQIANELGRAKKASGVNFLVLDKTMRLARVGPDESEMLRRALEFIREVSTKGYCSKSNCILEGLKVYAKNWLINNGHEGVPDETGGTKGPD